MVEANPPDGDGPEVDPDIPESADADAREVSPTDEADTAEPEESPNEEVAEAPSQDPSSEVVSAEDVQVPDEAEAADANLAPADESSPPAPPKYRGPLPTDAGWTPPGVPEQQSSYLQWLPGIFQTNEFLGRFLLIFESVLSPVNRTAENIHHYFDPYVTPPELIDWLGAWVGLALDQRWPEERRRDLIASAVNLYQWRGTKYGLSEFLQLYTGVEPEILEPTLSEIGRNRAQTFRFTVRIKVPKGTALDRGLIESIIDAEKPAFAACTLEILED